MYLFVFSENQMDYLRGQICITGVSLQICAYVCGTIVNLPHCCIICHTSDHFVLKYCLSLPPRIDPPLSFPLTNVHMCPPLSLFHGVIANTASNGRKKWGLHANFGAIVSSGNIHTKHNAVIITVQSPASSSVSPPGLVLPSQDQRNFGMWSLNEML